MNMEHIKNFSSFLPSQINVTEEDRFKYKKLQSYLRLR